MKPSIVDNKGRCSSTATAIPSNPAVATEGRSAELIAELDRELARLSIILSESYNIRPRRRLELERSVLLIHNLRALYQIDPLPDEGAA